MFFYGDTEDFLLMLITGIGIFTCCSTTLLVSLFPCSCNPRRDCRRSCADCKKDRETCRRRCLQRERADTEEELIDGPTGRARRTTYLPGKEQLESSELDGV
jgi:hypothetical protein